MNDKDKLKKLGIKIEGNKVKKSEAAECPCENREWGFFGTTSHVPGIDESLVRVSDEAVEKAYMKALKALMDQYGITQEQAVIFLDSRSGRYLADEISHFVDFRKLHNELSEIAEKHMAKALDQLIGSARWNQATKELKS